MTVLLYAKQENEEVFHPLHLVPPTLVGLALAASFLFSYYFTMLIINFLDWKQVQIRSKKYSQYL